MAITTTRAAFKEYCLRKLGAGVIDINVTDEQVEDRIDEALQYYADYHYSGTEHVYYKHPITETDKSNEYIPIPEDIIGIVQVFDVSSVTSSSGLFNVEYQFLLQNLSSLTESNLVGYYMGKQHLSLIQEILSGKSSIRYNRHLNKLHIDTNWSSMVVGNFILIEAYKMLDVDNYPDIWKDRWLQNYTATLIKEQWGSNLTKFTGMTLPGNMMFNGEVILNDAREERRKMEEEMINSFSLPISNFIG